jgi:hypothetical protein
MASTRSAIWWRNPTWAPATGRLEHIGGSIGAIFNRQNLSRSYDVLGNLKSRRDQRESLDLRESFCYDGLNRLVKQHGGTLTGSCAGINHSNGDIRYDTLGNITYKEGVGSYTYGSSRPHAVTQAGAATYSYDANGNMLTGKSATFSYGVFNKPLTIARSGSSSAFAYGIERDRYQRVDQIGSDTTTTWYVGNAELIERPSGAREIKRRIAGRVMVTHSINASGEVTATDTAYLLKDHLGSVVAVLNNSGNNVQAMAFDPWGHRRNAADWPSLLALYQSGWDTSHITRGFTSHEHLDALECDRGVRFEKSGSGRIGQQS